jgi:hypothetical protein
MRHGAASALVHNLSKSNSTCVSVASLCLAHDLTTTNVIEDVSTRWRHMGKPDESGQAYVTAEECTELLARLNLEQPLCRDCGEHVVLWS